MSNRVESTGRTFNQFFLKIYISQLCGKIHFTTLKIYFKSNNNFADGHNKKFYAHLIRPLAQTRTDMQNDI